MNRLQSALLGNTHNLTTTTGGLGVLTTDSQTPRVTETTMDTDLLHALKVLTVLVVEIVGEEVGELTVLDILLTIEEPIGDLVLARVLHDGDDTLQISLVEFTGTNKIPSLIFKFKGIYGVVPLVNVNLSLTADKEGVTATATSDSGQGEHDLLTTINVSVEDTKNVLESRLLRNVQRPNGEKKRLVSRAQRMDGQGSSGITSPSKEVVHLSDRDPCKIG